MEFEETLDDDAELFAYDSEDEAIDLLDKFVLGRTREKDFCEFLEKEFTPKELEGTRAEFSKYETPDSTGCDPACTGATFIFKGNDIEDIYPVTGSSSNLSRPSTALIKCIVHVDVNKLILKTLDNICENFKHDYYDNTSKWFGFEFKEAIKQDNFRPFIEFFNMESTKKNKAKFSPISALDNYILRSNKGKKIAISKKNLKANLIDDFDAGIEIIQNTKKFLSLFYQNYSPSISPHRDFMNFKVDCEQHKSLFFIFTDLDCVGKNNVKTRTYFKNLLDKLTHSKRKKILKIVNNYMFYFNPQVPNSIFCSEQQTTVWPDGKYYTLTK